MSRWSREAKESEINTTGRTAVDRDAHAGDERGSRRYEKADEIGNVLGRRNALQRVVLDSLCTLIIHALPGRRGLCRDEAFPARGGRRRRRNPGDKDPGRRAEVG